MFMVGMKNPIISNRDIPVDPANVVDPRFPQWQGEAWLPSGDIPRYSPMPMPETRYIPGFTPKPENHSSLILRLYEVKVLTPRTWGENMGFLYGIDLLNHAYFWEVHEVLEQIWHYSGRSTSTPGLLLQALIQTAAALLKLQSGQTAAGHRLSLAAQTKVTRFNENFMGIDLPQWRNLLLHLRSHHRPERPMLRLRQHPSENSERMAEPQN